MAETTGLTAIRMRPEPEEIGKKRGVKPLFLMVLMEDETGLPG